MTALPRFAGTEKRDTPVVSVYICVICGLFSLPESAKPELSMPLIIPLSASSEKYNIKTSP